MKLLLISFWFPPTNAIGAVRVGKFAKYLHQAGHDIRVLAGPEIDSLTLPLELPAELVVRPANAEVSGASPAQPSRALRLMRRIGALGVASEAVGLGAPRNHRPGERAQAPVPGVAAYPGQTHRLAAARRGGRPSIAENLAP